VSAELPDLPIRRHFSFARLATLDDTEANAVIAGFQEAFSWLRRPDLVQHRRRARPRHRRRVPARPRLRPARVTEDAQFTMAEVALGLVPDLGGTKRLVELVGYARAMDICSPAAGSGAPRRTGWAWPPSVVPATAWIRPWPR
jgi:hypothetical protein